MRVFITSGKKYIDIDAYASIFAYQRLLKSLGVDAYAYNKAPFNESISKEILKLGFTFDEVEIEENDKLIILDVSNPDFFYDIKKENIKEIIDHHVGFESYWKNYPTIQTTIEFIGSICTIIFEKFKEHSAFKLLDQNLCKLLMAGILDNTLNLKANVTQQRDKEAYINLQKLGNVEEDFPSQYFHSCYDQVKENLAFYLQGDIKHEYTNEYLPACIGQLIVLRKEDVLNQLNIVNQVFEKEESYLVNVIDIEEGASYLIYSPKEIKENMETLWKKKAEESYLKLDHVILRKEIIKYAREFKKSN